MLRSLVGSEMCIRDRDYSDLLTRLKETTKAVVVLGEIASELKNTFAPLADIVPVTEVGTLEEAVSEARALATSGDTILFSPGTSSFDMFAGYEQRGDCFREIANNLQ